MITQQHRQEQLSRAYLQAVTAQAGHLFDPPVLDYGVDGSLKHVKNRNGRRIPSGYSIDVQLKATTTWFERGNTIVYDVETKTYNDLIDRVNTPHGTPLILVVLCLPHDETQWLDVNHDRLLLKHCCYWCCPSGLPTENQQTQRIEIPKQNLVNSDAITALLQKVVNGEAII